MHRAALSALTVFVLVAAQMADQFRLKIFPVELSYFDHGNDQREDPSMLRLREQPPVGAHSRYC